MRSKYLFLLSPLFAVLLGCQLGCELSLAVDSKPNKDLMDSPIPPGDTPGDAKKMKVCPDGECDGGPMVPVWSSSSSFTGLDGNGTGYCVSYTMPDGTPGRVDVPFHKPTDNEGLRKSVGAALRVLGGEAFSRCMERASRKPLHAQAKAAEVCHAQAAQIERRASDVRFSWEPERPFMMVGGDPIVCTCATLIADPGVVGPRYSCGGACGNCVSCG